MIYFPELFYFSENTKKNPQKILSLLSWQPGKQIYGNDMLTFRKITESSRICKGLLMVCSLFSMFENKTNENVIDGG